MPVTAGYAAVAILLTTNLVSFERALLTVARFGQNGDDAH